ncbi:MAG: hypothetical protein V4506_04940 [Bacteroidota bacterium]
MKSLLIIIVTVMLFSSLSCKKKNTTPDPLPPTYGTSTTPPNYGTLQTMLIQYYNGHTFMRTDSMLTASFYASPVTSTLSTMVNAGTVSFNNIRLQNTTNQYQDSTHTLNIHQANSVWNISGSSSVPAFSYTVTPSYPTFIGNNLLPDSVSKAAGVVITLVGASNIANYGIAVEIISGGVIAHKSLAPNQTSCTFLSSDLALLSPSTNAMIIIVFSNGTQQTFGGKAYAFDNVLEHIKYIKLKS